jgi:hypothetical protein
MALRGIFRAMMDTTATHERNVPTTDANGGPVANWTTVLASFKCSIWPLDTAVATDYAQRQIAVSHAICTDTDLGAKPADRINVAGVYYIVKGLEPYSNTRLLGRPLYVMHCDRRTS